MKMKKVLSLALVVVLVVVMSISASAAAITTSAGAQADIATWNLASYEKGVVTGWAAKLTDAQAAAVDWASLKTVAEALERDCKAGTVTPEEIVKVQSICNAAIAPIGSVLTVKDISVDTVARTASANVSITLNGKSSGFYPVSRSWTASATPAVTGSSSVIKQTGSSVANGALMLFVAIAATMGVATLKSRKVAA